MARMILCALLVFALPSCTATQPKETSVSCDRACLKDYINRYLAALVKHDPSRLPLAATVRFTEDARELPLGSGFWKTATKLGTYRQDFLDVRAATAGSLVVVEEGNHPALLVLRLKIVTDRINRISEIETMVVHNEREGAFMDVAALRSASPAMAVIPPADQRESREAAIRIATRYPAGLKVGSFVTADTPFAPGTYRFENGRRMAGPGCTFRPPSCEDIRAQKIPTLPDITYRVAAVDEELGIVWLRLDFGPGSIGPKENALHAWEAFKVYGGQIHAVEAFMKVMPAHMPSGWDDSESAAIAKVRPTPIAPVSDETPVSGGRQSAVMVRLAPSEIAALAAAGANGGSGVQMTNLIGDPTKSGLYTVRVAIPAHTQVRPHTHRDNRSVTVMSGTWHMGYGTTFDAKALKDLPAGSIYTEPAGQPHFAQTTDEPVVIWVTGDGPSDTQFVTH